MKYLKKTKKNIEELVKGVLNLLDNPGDKNK